MNFNRSLLIGLLACLPWVASAAEHIISYDSLLDVQEDASLLVTETIVVRAEGQQIRRGIYRDFPTRYQDHRGNRFNTTFEVIEVRRNGETESWFTERRSNGVRLYIGSSDSTIPTGRHEFRITYRSDWQLGFFENHDEIYWNVTGDGWAFPIASASARVTLPREVNRSDLEAAAFSGAYGSQQGNVDIRIVDGATADFQTTTALNPREQLTIVLAFPKGLVREPSTSERASRFLSDNKGVLAMLIGIAVVLTWYLWAWNLVGKDPEEGVIIPRFEPPKGLTPAACRYVLDMGMREASFTAAVISLGVKGYLRIDEDDGDFTLRRQSTQAGQEASPGESAVMEALLPGKTRTIVLDNDNHSEFGAARKGLAAALSKEHKGRLFNLNGIYALPAVLTSILAGVGGLLLGASPIAIMIYAPLSIALHILFIFLLRAPTPAGRRIMDEIEGFKMYLGTAERDRLEMMRSPEMTPEVFEAFLPFAFALGVENSWCERFQAELPHLQEGENAYHPAWYSGNLRGASAMNHIASDLGGDLGGAISSAATPPGSSSGSGGGGFSGGGGGGGGGGGW